MVPCTFGIVMVRGRVQLINFFYYLFFAGTPSLTEILALLGTIGFIATMLLGNGKSTLIFRQFSFVFCVVCMCVCVCDQQRRSVGRFESLQVPNHACLLLTSNTIACGRRGW